MRLNIIKKGKSRLHYQPCLTWKHFFITVYILVKKQQKLAPGFGLRKRPENDLQMRKQHITSEYQDFSPDVTDHRGRNYHAFEDNYTRTNDGEDYWDKPKYNCYVESDYNKHGLKTDVHSEWYIVKDKPFIQCSCKIYAYTITVALFLFLVALIVFWNTMCGFYSSVLRSYPRVVMVFVWPFSLWWAGKKKQNIRIRNSAIYVWNIIKE